MFKRLLAAKGIHFLITKFGPRKLRSLAFDEKYRKGDWIFHGDGAGQLAGVVRNYLRRGDLLIMGCGGATILEDLASEEFNSALGVDLSSEALRLANRFASEKITFQQADMVTFECPRSYDVILFSESLNYVHAAQQEMFLKRLGKSLKAGGVFVVTLAQAKRFRDILDRIRQHFAVREDRSFPGSVRQVIVFALR